MTPHLPVSALAPRPVAPDMAATVAVARETAPYLARLMTRDGGDLDLSGTQAVVAQCEAKLAELETLAAAAPLAVEEASARLRRTKRHVHLLLALLDLAGHWGQGEVTARLTRLADLSLQVALNAALAAHGLAPDGLFLVAFGKMGAHELNYSSDIDIAAFFNAGRFHGGDRDPQEASVRVVREVCRLMEA